MQLQKFDNHLVAWSFILMQQETCQRILDHFHCGKIIELTNTHPIYKVRTSMGKFLVFEHPGTRLTVARESRLPEEIIQNIGPMQRCLLPNYKGELDEASSFAHVEHRYYSVYRILDDTV